MGRAVASSCLSILSAGVAALVLAPADAAAQSGGPDGYGNTYTYGGAPPYESIAAAVGVVDLTPPGCATCAGNGDDGAAEFVLPFDMLWYGQTWDALWVSINGTLRFADQASSVPSFLPYDTQPFPNTVLNGPDIAAFWMDLDVRVIGHVYALSLPGEVIISWEGVGRFSQQTDPVSFQIRLFEDGALEFAYEDTFFNSTSNGNSGAAASIGIQASDLLDTNADYNLPVSFNQPTVPDGTTIHFGLADYCADLDEDGDLDATCGGNDCNDNEPTINSFASEACGNGVDDDCDGDVDEDCCPDADEDGHADLSCGGDDCDDGNADVHPGAAEICDGLDNDCSDGVPADELDGDGDTVIACADCDDADFLNFPGNSELCDGQDNDCNGGDDFLGYGGSEDDSDFDGQSDCEGDCDDENPGRFTGNPEICDGLDNDCNDADDFLGYPGSESDGDFDGVSDCGGDCDDEDFFSYPGAPEVCDDTVDQDCDGSDLPADFDGDGFAALGCGGADCDDSDSAVSPGAAEICDDGGDEDCDGIVDDLNIDAIASDTPVSILDNTTSYSVLTVALDRPLVDVDAIVDITHTFDGDLDLILHAPGGDSVDLSLGNGGSGDNFTLTGFDDESPVSIFDGEAPFDGVFAPEGSLSDLDGLSSVGLWQLEVTDAAGGDEGTLNVFALRLSIADSDVDGDGVSLCEGDCDDDDNANFPGNTETCDGADNDCDGVAGGEDDEDGDGFMACADCDDTDADIHPGAEEFCNGIDDDCDPTTWAEGLSDELDLDEDGFRYCEDCNDFDELTFPGATETCDGADNNCDGVTDDENDQDGDGEIDCLDCDDDDPNRFSGNLEACDGVDNDCDLEVPANESDEDGDHWFACDDCDDDEARVHPGAAEDCNGVDNDCDGSITDEEEDVDGDGYAPCDDDCDDGSADVAPGADEVCNGLDDNCDGFLHDDEQDADMDGYLECDAEEPDCHDEAADANPGIDTEADDACADGLDNDCDGLADASDPDCPGGSGAIIVGGGWDGCPAASSMTGRGRGVSGLASLGLLAALGLARGWRRRSHGAR